ncbi:MAG: formylglycine-generating enzyme family protein [Gammaproteobacteria bacterium]|nr:formylglycine-generating enzyme family protein [Gammaproteobacteria bacterium]
MMVDRNAPCRVRLAVAAMLLVGAVFGESEETSGRFRDCSTCPEMVVVPAGDFLRGSPQDEPGRGLDSRNHDEDDVEGPGGKRVRVSVPAFALGVFEVTNGQFGRFVQDTGYEMPSGCFSDANQDGVWARDETGTWNNLGREFRLDYPASCIDWHAANAYVHWLGLRTGGRYRLPTEAEFEYALRAGSDAVYHFGDDQELLCEYGNVPDQSLNAVSPEQVTTACSDGFADMAPVGRFKPNAFGLHDMTGNVWEWLQDCYERSYADVPADGSALHKEDCAAYSIRGGSFGYDLPSLRSADRSDDPPDALFDGIGLRVARDLVPEPDAPDWRLRVFEDRAHGVSVLYPASYTTVVEGTDKLLSVASPYGVPRMDLEVTPDAGTDVAELAQAYVASLLAVGDRGRPFPRPSDGEGPDPVTDADTAVLHGNVVAEQVTVDWHAPESQAELRTLVLSVRDASRGRITLYLTGTRRHDWEDLRRLAHTLRVNR